MGVKKKKDKPTNFDVMFNRVTEIFHDVEQKTYLCSFFNEKKICLNILLFEDLQEILFYKINHLCSFFKIWADRNTLSFLENSHNFGHIPWLIYLFLTSVFFFPRWRTSLQVDCQLRLWSVGWPGHWSCVRGTYAIPGGWNIVNSYT